MPLRPTRLAALLATLPLLTLGLASAAEAAPASDRGASCAPAAGARASLTRGPDTRMPTDRELRAVERELAAAATSPAGSSASRAPARAVDVHVHVVGSETVRGPSRERVRRQLRVLVRAYDGGQSADNADTGFRFKQRSFERVRNDRWHRARPGSDADRAMRVALHRGGIDDLNVYVLEPRLPQGQTGQLFGWSTFPWEITGGGRRDGITLHQATLPGGSFTDYNLGDTLVHEAGHWLGLLHTFQGGCSTPNDGVDDTPAQLSASADCPDGLDTCDLPGLDPTHNFMDYPTDPCLFEFTPGQVDRMDTAWTVYRAGTT